MIFKVGRSENIGRRIADVRRGYVQPLVLIGKLDGDKENEIHRALKSKKVFGANEWFRCTEESLSILGKFGFPTRRMWRAYRKKLYKRPTFGNVIEPITHQIACDYDFDPARIRKIDMKKLLRSAVKREKRIEKEAKYDTERYKGCGWNYSVIKLLFEHEIVSFATQCGFFTVFWYGCEKEKIRIMNNGYRLLCFIDNCDLLNARADEFHWYYYDAVRGDLSELDYLAFEPIQVLLDVCDVETSKEYVDIFNVKKTEKLLSKAIKNEWFLQKNRDEGVDKLLCSE